MVIGGGPAGLVAARTAAIKGHDVSLYEASSHLGGQFRSAAYPIEKVNYLLQLLLIVLI